MCATTANHVPVIMPHESRAMNHARRSHESLECGLRGRSGRGSRNPRHKS